MVATPLGVKREFSTCVFSDDRKYRYVLRHCFDQTKPDADNFQKSVNFVMLNPSTADEQKLDPTLRRCRSFAKQWDFGSFVVTNLFAYRATDPTSLLQVYDPVGPSNDQHILIEAYKAKLVVIACGTHGRYLERYDRVLPILLDYATDIARLGSFNANGTPKHSCRCGQTALLRTYSEVYH